MTKQIVTCSLENCDGIQVAQQLCNKHYRRFRKYGTVELPPKPKKQYCTIADCNRPTKGRGYCGKHWFRWRVNGDPLKVKAWVGEGATPIEKFWSKVALTADTDRCWMWQGSGNGKYGRFQYKKKKWYAHQLSWALTHDEVPTLQILHHCDIKMCVNPNHLYQGTHQQNMDDLFWRGNWKQRASVTEMDFHQIQDMFHKKATLAEVGNRFNISISVASSIRCGKHWSNIFYGGSN